ncbi:transposase [Komagataeibacter sp. FNDCR1]|nr:transposase [Komagataeibacter sp. FNDCR1]
MTQEILIGVERRRRWSDERKLAILAEVGVDGASVSDVARRHDLTRQHLYQWRTSFRQRLSSPDRNRPLWAALIMRPVCAVYSRVSSSMATVRGAG